VTFKESYTELCPVSPSAIVQCFEPIGCTSLLLYSSTLIITNLCRNCIEISLLILGLHNNPNTRKTTIGENSVIEKFQFQYNK